MKLFAEHPLLVALTLLGVHGTARAQEPGELEQLQVVVQEAIAKTAPCIVTVETFGGTRKLLAQGGPAADAPQGKPESRPRRSGSQPKPEPAPQPPKQDEKKLGPIVMPGFLQAQGATTGIVLDADGWILVSRFAMNLDPTTILVTLADGRAFNARRAGEDTSRGLALLKIEAKDLPVPRFVAPGAVHVGQWAFALGRTFGRGTPSISAGIVSAVGRLFGRAVQIDANSSPANYGGPVIDLDGGVIGVAVPLSATGRDAGAELYDSGIGFAASVADIRPLLERMKQGEVLNRGWLGVATKVDDIGPGATIENVPKGGAAEAAGLLKGDTILEVDGVKVRHSFHLQVLIGAKMAGDPVHLSVQRKDVAEHIGLTIFLREVPEAERKAKPAATEGEQPQFPWDDKGK